MYLFICSFIYLFIYLLDDLHRTQEYFHSYEGGQPYMEEEALFCHDHSQVDVRHSQHRIYVKY